MVLNWKFINLNINSWIQVQAFAFFLLLHSNESPIRLNISINLVGLVLFYGENGTCNVKKNHKFGKQAFYLINTHNSGGAWTAEANMLPFGVFGVIVRCSFSSLEYEYSFESEPELETRFIYADIFSEMNTPVFEPFKSLTLVLGATFVFSWRGRKKKFNLSLNRNGVDFILPPTHQPVVILVTQHANDRMD